MMARGRLTTLAIIIASTFPQNNNDERKHNTKHTRT